MMEDFLTHGFTRDDINEIFGSDSSDSDKNESEMTVANALILKPTLHTAPLQIAIGVAAKIQAKALLKQTFIKQFIDSEIAPDANIISSIKKFMETITEQYIEYCKSKSRVEYTDQKKKLDRNYSVRLLNNLAVLLYRIIETIYLQSAEGNNNLILDDLITAQGDYDHASDDETLDGVDVDFPALIENSNKATSTSPRTSPRTRSKTSNHEYKLEDLSRDELNGLKNRIAG